VPHAPPHVGLHLAKSGRIEPARRMKNHPRRGVVAGGFEYAVDDAAVKVQVHVQGRAEAVDEDDRPQACRGTAAGTVLAQTAFDHAQKDAQDHALQRRIIVQEIVQALGYGKHHRFACLGFRFAASNCRSGNGGKT
jgi:hypothetical protein